MLESWIHEALSTVGRWLPPPGEASAIALLVSFGSFVLFGVGFYIFASRARRGTSNESRSTTPGHHTEISGLGVKVATNSLGVAFMGVALIVYFAREKLATLPCPDVPLCPKEIAFLKGGENNGDRNNGERNCRDFCGNNGADWGRGGTCIGGVRPETGESLRCDEPPPGLGHELVCYCRP